MNPVHVLNEARSPVDALVYHMHCGASCFVWEDVETEPSIDFYLEQDATEATCESCKQAMRSKIEDSFIVLEKA